MNNEFIPYEQASQLKDLGFSNPCVACYDKLDMLSTYSNIFEPKNYNNSAYCTSAPLYQQVFRWFRDEHDLHVQIRRENYFYKSKYEYYHFDISKGLENDITKQEDLYSNILDECSQDIEGNYLNDEKFYKLIFERKFAFKTYEEIELYSLKKLIEIIKNKN